MSTILALLLNMIIAICFWLTQIFSSASVFADEAEPALVQLQQYKPIYFLAGTPDTKAQLSFKGQIVRDLPLYFAYSQLVMWELFNQTGSPIHDVNYNPEAFYRIYTQPESARWIDLGLFEHESNGHGGTEQERSWNRVSLLYHSWHRLGQRLKLIWSLKAWYPLTYNLNNTGLAQYRGVWELQFTLVDFLGPFFESNDLTLRIYPGGATYTNPLQGAQELTFRAKAKYRSFLPLLIFQIFHGFGENMLDYQDHRLAIRAGIGF